MTRPTVSLTEQMLRRRPVVGAPVAHGASDHLKRSIGTFQLDHVRRRRDGRHRYLHRAAAGGAEGRSRRADLVRGRQASPRVSAICYAEMAAAVPVSGSTYSYAYTTMGEVRGDGRGRLPASGVRRLACGDGHRLERLPEQTSRRISSGGSYRISLMAAPWVTNPGIVNLPAMVLIVMCALLLIRGASESAKVNTIMVIIKLCVLACSS